MVALTENLLLVALYMLIIWPESNWLHINYWVCSTIVSIVTHVRIRLCKYEICCMEQELKHIRYKNHLLHTKYCKQDDEEDEQKQNVDDGFEALEDLSQNSEKI